MSPFRLLISGRLSDPDAFRVLGARWTEYVRENEPGTLKFDWYIDDDGHFMNEDAYGDDRALLRHIWNAEGQGLLEDYVALAAVEQVHVIGEVGDPGLEALAPWSPVHLKSIEER